MLFIRKSLNESTDLLIMKILTENADSCDLTFPRETGVERHFKTYQMIFVKFLLSIGTYVNVQTKF